MPSKIIPFPSTAERTLDVQLRFAIANKRLLRVTYDGAKRIVEPHDYGVRNGKAKLLVFQRDKAGRQTGAARGWRTLDLSKIRHCVVLADAFAGSRQAADQQHLDWDLLYARVDHTL